MQDGGVVGETLPPLPLPCQDELLAVGAAGLCNVGPERISRRDAEAQGRNRPSPSSAPLRLSGKPAPSPLPLPCQDELLAVGPAGLCNVGPERISRRDAEAQGRNRPSPSSAPLRLRGKPAPSPLPLPCQDELLVSGPPRCATSARNGSPAEALRRREGTVLLSPQRPCASAGNLLPPLLPPPPHSPEASMACFTVRFPSWP